MKELYRPAPPRGDTSALAWPVPAIAGTLGLAPIVGRMVDSHCACSSLLRRRRPTSACTYRTRSPAVEMPEPAVQAQEASRPSRRSIAACGRRRGPAGRGEDLPGDGLPRRRRTCSPVDGALEWHSRCAGRRGLGEAKGAEFRLWNAASAVSSVNCSIMSPSRI